MLYMYACCNYAWYEVDLLGDVVYCIVIQYCTLCYYSGFSQSITSLETYTFSQ